jgi:hypothetical protein
VAVVMPSMEQTANETVRGHARRSNERFRDGHRPATYPPGGATGPSWTPPQREGCASA